VITQEQSTLAEAKKHQLAGARAFVAAGKYDEAIRRYDAFLAQYPESVTAREERDDAQEMLDKSRKSGTQITSTAKSRQGSGTRAPATKPSRWQRLRHWVRRE
jgi:hypothetical protein